MEEQREGITGEEKKEIINCFEKSAEGICKLSKWVKEDRIRVLINENLNTLMFSVIWFAISKLVEDNWAINCMLIMWVILSILAMIRLFKLCKELNWGKEK